MARIRIFQKFKYLIDAFLCKIFDKSFYIQFVKKLPVILILIQLSGLNNLESLIFSGGDICICSIGNLEGHHPDCSCSCGQKQKRALQQSSHCHGSQPIEEPKEKQLELQKIVNSKNPVYNPMPCHPENKNAYLNNLDKDKYTTLDTLRIIAVPESSNYLNIIINKPSDNILDIPEKPS